MPDRYINGEQINLFIMSTIDIIIVTYNAKKTLARCLSSVVRYTHNFDYQITIVDNKSTDGTLEYLKKCKMKINLINNRKNFGFCKAANIGLKNTVNKYIVFLDDDATVTEGWLEGLYDQIKMSPKVGIVGAKIVFPNKRICSADYSIFLRQSPGNYEVDRGQRDYIKKTDALIGTCWLMRREVIRDVGYFDENFFPCQYEDIDYCLRTRLAGYTIIYNGKVTVVHHNLCRDGGRFAKNRDKFSKKWKKSLSKFPLKNSSPVDKHIARGLDFFKKKRFKQALIEFKKPTLIDPIFSEPLLVGRVLEEMGKYADAILEYKKFLRLNDLHFAVYCHLGFCYENLGKIKIAQKLYMKSIYYKEKFFSGRKAVQCIERPI